MEILVTPHNFLAPAGCRIVRALACIIAALSFTRPAAAQSDAGSRDAARNPVSIAVGADISQDSNLFRQPSSAQVTSDTITVAYVGLRVDKQVSLQRFQLDITETITKYAKTSYLDFDALDYRGAWLWQIGSRISGTLSADRKESLVPFEDILNPGNPSRNIRISENQAFSLDARALGDWHLLLGANQSSQTSERSVEIQPDFEAVSHEAGIRYAPATGSYVSLLRRSTTGDYLNQSSSPVLGTGYKQDETELKASWAATGKSTLTGRLTWLERTQNSAAQRDFSGVAGEFIYTLAATGQLNINFIAKRDIAPFQDPSASYIVSDTFSVAPVWKITGKTILRLLALHSSSSFDGAASGPVTGPAREDTLNLIELGASWSAVNRLIFGASLMHQARDSTIPAFAFKNTILRVTASYLF